MGFDSRIVRVTVDVRPISLIHVEGVWNTLSGRYPASMLLPIAPIFAADCFGFAMQDISQDTEHRYAVNRAVSEKALVEKLWITAPARGGARPASLWPGARCFGAGLTGRCG